MNLFQWRVLSWILFAGGLRPATGEQQQQSPPQQQQQPPAVVAVVRVHNSSCSIETTTTATTATIPIRETKDSALRLRGEEQPQQPNLVPEKESVPREEIEDDNRNRTGWFKILGRLGGSLIPSPRSSSTSSLRLRFATAAAAAKDDDNEQQPIDNSQQQQQPIDNSQQQQQQHNPDGQSYASAAAIAGSPREVTTQTKSNSTVWLFRLGRVIVALLPSSHTLSERNRKRRRRQQLSDPAPFVVRVWGTVLSPIFSRTVSALLHKKGEDFVPDDDTMQQQVHWLLSQHPQVRRLFGTPLLIAPPLPSRTGKFRTLSLSSQVPDSAANSTNTTTTTTTQRPLEWTFTISGSKQAGIAYLIVSPDGGGIEFLSVTNNDGTVSLDIIPKNNR